MRILWCLTAVLIPFSAASEVFHSKESALRLAFPGADRVTAQDLFLSPEETAQVEREARAEVDSRLVTVYVGHEGPELLGYAFLDTHQVRTLPQTILVVLDPGGAVRAIHLLAFHEPPEYQAPVRWLERLAGRTLDAELWPGRDVDSLSGATLTATAVTAAVRRLLAVHRVKLAGEAGSS
jgi:transcriptional regulator of nitric oxide reductase